MQPGLARFLMHPAPAGGLLLGPPTALGPALETALKQGGLQTEANWTAPNLLAVTCLGGDAWEWAANQSSDLTGEVGR